MKKLIILIVTVLLTALLSNTAMSQSFSGIQWDWYDIAARTAIATGNKNIAPDSCAALQIGKDTTKYGLLLPRVVDTVIAGQKKGLLIYRHLDNNIYFYNGVKWQPLTTSSNTSGLDAVLQVSGLLNTSRDIDLNGNGLTMHATSGLFEIEHDGSGGIRFNDGTQGPGKVWTSDIDGNGSWQTPVTGMDYDTLNYYYDETTLINYITAKLQLTALKADSNTWYPTMYYVNSIFSTGMYRYYSDTILGTVAGYTKLIFKTRPDKGRFIIERIRFFGLDVPSVSAAGVLTVGTNFPNYDDIANISLSGVPLNTTTIGGSSSSVTIPPGANVYAHVFTPATGSNLKISVYIYGYYQKD